MKGQFSIVFITILTVLFLLGMVLLLAIFSSINLTNYKEQTSFSYQQKIIYSLFSPNCIGYPNYPIYFTTMEKIRQFNQTYYNMLPNCTIFPYTFRAEIGNYSFGIINFNGNCNTHTYPISVYYSLDYIKLTICKNYYSDFYYFLYSFCLSDKNISNQTFVFLFPTNLSGNITCTENTNGNIICNYIPCYSVNNITFYQLVTVYVKRINQTHFMIA
ncbi:MAG: hypothetical protein ACO2ON_02075 [Candidatus Nanopusillus sp.]